MNEWMGEQMMPSMHTHSVGENLLLVKWSQQVQFPDNHIGEAILWPQLFSRQFLKLTGAGWNAGSPDKAPGRLYPPPIPFLSFLPSSFCFGPIDYSSLFLFTIPWFPCLSGLLLELLGKTQIPESCDCLPSLPIMGCWLQLWNFPYPGYWHSAGPPNPPDHPFSRPSHCLVSPSPAPTTIESFQQKSSSPRPLGDHTPSSRASLVAQMVKNLPAVREDLGLIPG